LAGKSVPRVAEIIEVAPSTIDRWRKTHKLYQEYASKLEQEREAGVIAAGALEAQEDAAVGALEAGVMGELRRMAVEAVQGLRDMMQSDNERVRLQAYAMVLDKAGYVAPARRQSPAPRGPRKGVDRLRELDGATVSREGLESPQQANAGTLTPSDS